MAILVVVSVRDRAADVFMRPFFVPSSGMAIRSFANEVNRADENNPLYMNPEDFDLYELAMFDESDGSFEPYKQPAQIAIGKDCRAAFVAKTAKE